MYKGGAEVLRRVYDGGKHFIGIDALFPDGSVYFIDRVDMDCYSYTNAKVTSDLRLLGDIKDSRVETNEVILYHGSSKRILKPTYGFPNSNNDFGSGFYLTQYEELGKEWAFRKAHFEGGKAVGFLHTYVLRLSGLKVFDFSVLNDNLLSWVAELLRHRVYLGSWWDSELTERFIRRYGIDFSGYDVIVGYRGDISYFEIVKAFMKNSLDYTLMNECLRVLDLSSVVLKSKKAYNSLYEKCEPKMIVGEAYMQSYADREKEIESRVKDVVSSPKNTKKLGVRSLFK